MRIFYFSETQQDTLILQPQQQNQPFPNITVRKPQLDLERAEEIIKQFEQREQEIIISQDSAARPAIPNPKIPESRIPDSTIHGVSDTDSVEVKIFELEVFESLNPAESLNPVERQISYPSSITLSLTVGLILLTIIRYNFGKNLMESFLSFFSYRKSMRIYEEHRESDRQSAFLSNILFTWITGIFISITLPFFRGGPLWGSYILSVLFFSAAIGLLYFLKARIWQALGVIFMIQSFSKIYIHTMFLYNRNIGVMIFPLVAIIPYVTRPTALFMVYSVVVVFVVSYLFKLWRIFQIIHTRNVSVLYFILYLCTLEILPLLLFVKGCKILSDSVVV